MDFGIKNKNIQDYLFIIIGTTIMAVAMNMFYVPNNLVTGGVTGIAIVVKSLSNDFFGYSIPVWLTNVVLNIPLFLIAIKFKGKEFIKKTLFATVFLTGALFFTENLPAIKDDLIIASIFGGTLMGSGLGLVFKSMATTGGTDLAASIVNRFLKQYSVSTILFVMDSAIIIIGIFIFDTITAMYAIIAVYITSKVISSVLEGFSFAKAVFIISEHSLGLAKEVMSSMERGVTCLNGKGMYTEEEKNILLCVVSQKEIVHLKEIVEQIDKNAFIIVADVREVLGLGFGSFH